LYRKWSKKALKARHWFMAQIVAIMLAAMKLLPPMTATNAIARLATWVGPLTPRHKLALDNLALAFPEKTTDERKAIVRDMWYNMGLLAAEYVYLDHLFDYDPHSDKQGRVDVSPKAREIFTKLREEGGRYVFFTGHTGNFELLPICAATFGMEVTALFRPPNNPFIAKKVLAQRTTTMGGLVPSKAGAAWALSRALDNGKSVGVLVDQKFQRGRLGTFFGRPVKTNPLLPKLLRQHECPVYPARCVRLANNRFRLELEPALDIPLDPDGAIDIDATCQLLNDTVERWVREYPGQWMWFHRRWKL